MQTEKVKCQIKYNSLKDNTLTFPPSIMSNRYECLSESLLLLMFALTCVSLHVAAAQKHISVFRRLRDKRGHRCGLVLHLQTCRAQRHRHGVRSEGKKHTNIQT